MDTQPQPTWMDARERLRARGLRWTPQRRVLLDVLARSSGHLSSAEIVDRCAAVDPEIAPSTIYRTLEVLESLGLVIHGHGIDGDVEYHLLPDAEHGHLHCRVCRQTWEIRGDEAAALAARFDHELGFEVDLSHVTIVGRCGHCRTES
jgi:Fur family transcriptional regulator, ferric uptake regulator